MKIFNGMKLSTGLAVGVGAAVLLPVVAPVVAGALRPVAKAAVKGGILLVDRGREVAADGRDLIDDLAAEARHELNQKEGGVAKVTSPEEPGSHGV
jgi:hypothetical protein